VGKVKQRVGETVGNEELANHGVVDQAKGAAKEMWGNAKDAAKEVHQSHKDAAIVKTHETRDKISQSVQNAKEKVNREDRQIQGASFRVMRRGFNHLLLMPRSVCLRPWPQVVWLSSGDKDSDC